MLLPFPYTEHGYEYGPAIRPLNDYSAPAAAEMDPLPEETRSVWWMDKRRHELTRQTENTSWNPERKKSLVKLFFLPGEEACEAEMGNIRMTSQNRSR